MFRHWRTLALMLAGAFLTLQSLPAAAHRVALIIGNDRYQGLPALQKAAADARSYADLLRAQGFDDVLLKTDLTKGAMDEAIGAFLEKIGPGDTAVFAYSGHGWSDGAQNYLVGIDAPKAGGQEFLARISVPLRNGTNGVLDDMDRRGAALKVAIIDACRDNPFQPAVAGRSIGVTRGLTRIEPPRGTFVVFSAGTGQTALDRLSDSDANPNSVFTRAFVPLLRAGMPLQEATQKARREVVTLARSIGHDQQPAYYDELIGDACLSGNCDPPVPAEAPPPPAAGQTSVQAHAQASTQASAEAIFWGSISNSTNVADFEIYLKKVEAREFSGLFADLARSRIDAAKAPRLASLPPPSVPATPPPAAVAPSSVDLARRVQAELHRIGCDPGAEDGVWSAKSEAALKSFADKTGWNLRDFQPSQAALDRLTSRSARVCDPVASIAPSERAPGEAAKTLDGRWRFDIERLVGGECGSVGGRSHEILVKGVGVTGASGSLSTGGQFSLTWIGALGGTFVVTGRLADGGRGRFTMTDNRGGRQVVCSGSFGIARN